MKCAECGAEMKGYSEVETKYSVCRRCYAELFGDEDEEEGQVVEV